MNNEVRLNPVQAISTVPTAYHLYFSGERFAPERQAEFERNFFSAIRLKNGTYKFTYRNRLGDLNDLVQKHLPSQRPLKVMDVAVSSGVSTTEWVNCLEQAGVEFELVAGDLVVNTFLISIGESFHALVDPTGYQLQLDIRGKAISTPIGKRDLIRNLLPIMLLKMVTRLFFSTLRKACLKDPSSQQTSFWEISCRRLELVSPSLRQYANLRVVDDDILNSTGYQKCFHVIRAANILNRSYFSDAVLSTMLLNLRSRLMTNGLLVVCRTDKQGLNKGTLFVLRESGDFEIIAKLNDGVEIENLVLELPKF